MMPEILVLFTTQTTPDSYIQPGGIAFNLTATLIGMLLGGLLACILTVFVQQRLGSILRKIISFGARDRKSSRTMAEMDVRMTYTLRRALRARSGRDEARCLPCGASQVRPDEERRDARRVRHGHERPRGGLPRARRRQR